MKIWYFYCQYKASDMGTNRLSYNIFDLRHVSKSSYIVAEEKQNVHIFIQVSKQRKWKM